MSAPDPRYVEQAPHASNSKLLRIAMWVAIGALIAAAVVCVVWVLIGSQNGIIGRAFLTILLLAAFAGVAILDAHLAARRPPWFTLASMGTWVVTLLIGAFLIWMPESSTVFFDRGFARFASFLLIVLILQLALLHVRLFTKAIARNRIQFTTIVGYITIGLVVLLAIMLVVPLMLSEWIRFHDLYWRIVVAISILAAVGTALVPLVSALFSPKPARPAAPPVSQAWPTYVDGLTPLPVLPDGSPDWNAYYTGFPSPGATVVGGPSASAPPAPLPVQAGAQQWPAPDGHQPQPGAQAPQQWARQPEHAPQPAPEQQPWPAPHEQQQWDAPQHPQQSPQWPAPHEQTPPQWPAQQQQPPQWPTPPQQQWLDPSQQQWPAQQPPAEQPQPAHPPQQPPAGGYPPPPPLPPQQ